MVIGTSTTALTLSLPAQSSNAVFSITLTTPLSSDLSTSVTVQASSTPILSLSASSLTTPGMNTLTFSQTNTTSANPAYVEVYSKYNSNEIYNVSIPTQAISATVTFNVQLPGGIFGFRFYYISYGFATCADTLSITITQPTITSFVSSYSGRTFSISGTGLSPSATIAIAGFKTSLSNVTSTSAVATAPPLVTTFTQYQYGLATPEKLSLDKFTVISDSPTGALNAFDGQQGTTYSSTSGSACYLGIDVGSSLLLNLNRIRFFPYSRWTIASNYLLGATIEASTDGVQYDVIATVDATVHSGWNVLSFDLTQNYRYIKFVHNQISKCMLAEL